MQKPSLRKILVNDYLALLLAIGGPITLGVAVFLDVSGVIPKGASIGQEPDAGFIKGFWFCAVALTVVLLVSLVYRVSRIKHILARGPRLKARISEVGFFRDRGRIEFEYEHDGLRYTGGTAIMKNEQTSTFLPGNQIEIALEAGSPKSALIVELYCS